MNIMSMWRFEQYHYLPALALAVGFLFAFRWDRILRGPTTRFAWAMVVASIFAGIPLATVRFSPWLGTLFWVLVAGGFLASQRDTRGVSLLTLWPLCWLLLPLPMNLDQEVTAWVQLRSSQMSSYFLDILSVPHILQGNVIELTSRKLFVEEACSGVQSLFTLVFCAWLIVIGLQRSIWLLPIYAAAAIFWAGLMNIIRIVVIAIVDHHYGWDLSKGWMHEVLGYVCLAIATGLLLSTDRMFRVLFFPIRSDSSEAATRNPFTDTWNRLFAIPMKSDKAESIEPNPFIVPRPLGITVIVLSLGAFLWQAQAFATSITQASGGPSQTGNRFMQLPKSLDVEGFVQEKYETFTGRIDLPMGENADVWRGTLKGIPVALVISQPYPGWHDLSTCYSGVGWVKNDRYIRQSQDGGIEWPFAMTRWVCPEGTYGYVWYSAMDANGTAVDIPDRSMASLFRSFLNRNKKTSTEKVAMIQLVTESDLPLPPDAVEELEKLHLNCRERLTRLTGETAK